MLEYLGDMNKVLELSIGQQAIAASTDPKPVIATYGLASCVSVAGYEKCRKIGFLTHYTVFMDTAASLSDLVNALHRTGLSDDDLGRFEIRLIGGEGRLSEQINREIRRIIREKFSVMDIEEDTGYYDGYLQRGRSVVLDTRTGEFLSYNPKKNPYRTNRPERIKLIGNAELIHKPNDIAALFA